MNGQADDGANTICGGIDKRTIERFLLLIRDGYPAAELASTHLQRRALTLSHDGLRHLQDVLGCLASALDPTLPNEKREAHLKSAEEHLRSAVFNPYAIAFRGLHTSFDETYRKYCTIVLPARSRIETLLDAPTEDLIQIQLEELAHLEENGRTAAAYSLRDWRWEEGMASYANAFDGLSLLNEKLAGFCRRHAQAQEERQQRIRFRIQIGAAVISLLGLVLAALRMLGLVQ
jgi:hypothetical protein